MFRAANELLRMALDGSICLSLKPKNFSKNKTFWEEHPETKELDKAIVEVEALAKEKRSLVIPLSGELSEASQDTDNDEYENFYASKNSKNLNKIVIQNEISSEVKDDSSSENIENFYSVLQNE